MCTCAVRNCLECRHRLQPSTSTPSTPVPSSPASPKPAIVPTGTNGSKVEQANPIQALITGAQPSSKVTSRTHLLL